MVLGVHFVIPEPFSKTIRVTGAFKRLIYLSNILALNIIRDIDRIRGSKINSKKARKTSLLYKIEIWSYSSSIYEYVMYIKISNHVYDLLRKLQI